MKRIITIILVLIFALSLFSGCSGATENNNGKLSIVTTIFPEYDWIKNITNGAENVDTAILLDSGTDLHNYQPTAEDIIKISKCDVFIYVGGESDEWVADSLKGAEKKDKTVINLLDILGSKAKEEETVEGMQIDEHEEISDEPEFDEHVWLSLKNTSFLCEKISSILCEADPDNSEIYKKNTQEYIAKLNELDKKYQTARDSAKHDTLIFADRFPFRYLIDDYNLKYYAAFSGCSAESEASFETVAFLADKLDELKVPAVFKIDKSDGKIAKTVIETSNQKDTKTLVLNSMQSITAEDIENGANYLGIMESNLDVLSQAIKE